MELHEREIFTLEQMRVLAAADPRAAVRSIAEVLDSQDARAEAFLASITGPSDGRLRQVVASALRTREGRAFAAPHLRTWLGIETDEFTRRAILHALDGVEHAGPPTAPPQLLDLVPTYRYVAGRLTHQVRNALMLPMQRLDRLKTTIDGLADQSVRAQLAETLQQACDGFDRVGQIVEFDTREEFFSARPIALREWLREAGPKLLSGGQVEFEWRSDEPAAKACIVASPLLLTILFRNIWANAAEAAETAGRCRIQIIAEIDGGSLRMVVTDNGPGFPPTVRETAFRIAHSTKAEMRGRGLLEIGDAVERLRGSVALSETRPNEWRLQLVLPVE